MAKPNSFLLETLLSAVRSCRACADLPCGPRPVLRVHPAARLLLIGQAPGRRVHDTGVPWNDRSGARLRAWLGLSPEVFYGPLVAIIPMGLCYPGTGPRGDLPPRRQCAPLWFGSLRAQLPAVECTVLIGLHAIRYHLPQRQPLAALVRDAGDGHHLVLPHPSGRNNAWLARHPWFEAECLPALRGRIAALLA